jgi:hypothetical protein
MDNKDRALWRINPETPSVIITPHGRISISWTQQKKGEAVDYSLAEETAALIVSSVNAALSQSGRAETIEEVCTLIEPFAKAADAIDKHDEEWPDEGACLRPSFDWWAREGDKRAATTADLRRLRDLFNRLAAIRSLKKD